jgi:hypothetical protein
LQETILGRPLPAGKEVEASESLATLVGRLGPNRRVLFRLMTPPGIVAEEPGWVVVKVMVPGLQPMHGDHLLPFLGGPLWGRRSFAEWATIPPHPFP